MTQGTKVHNGKQSYELNYIFLAVYASLFPFSSSIRSKIHKGKKIYLKEQRGTRQSRIHSQNACPIFHILGKLACKIYAQIKRQAAAVKIQKNTRGHHARKAYKKLKVSVLMVQTVLRAMDARKRFRFRKQTEAAIIIQVRIPVCYMSSRFIWYWSEPNISLYPPQARWRCHKAFSYYQRLKRGVLVAQCKWRGRVAKKELRKLKMVSILFCNPIGNIKTHLLLQCLMIQ